MAEKRLGACLLSAPESIGYFTGLFLEGVYCLVLPDRAPVFANPLSFAEARHYGADRLEIEPEARFWRGKTTSPLSSPTGVEADLPAAVYERLRVTFPGASFAVTDCPLTVRAVKEPDEIALIRRAGRLMKTLAGRIARVAGPGARETDLARFVRDFLAARGAAEAFPTVAAAGYAALFPHASPRPAPVDGSWLVLDFGARVRWYCADCTRVLFPHRLTGAGRERLEALEAAAGAAVRIAGPGVPAARVDAVARRVLEQRGLGEYFIHGLGHGVGLSVHEKPGLYRASGDVLRPGMVITVEPGVYLPGWGGLRIEDTWLVTENGLENLTG